MCILFVYYTLLKVVSYYDFSFVYMLVIVFQKSLYGGWVGWSLSSFILDFWNCFNFENTLTVISFFLLLLLLLVFIIILKKSMCLHVHNLFMYMICRIYLLSH